MSTRQDIAQRIKDDNIRFLLFLLAQFLDIHGSAKGKTPSGHGAGNL